jgi:hypothetical protein
MSKTTRMKTLGRAAVIAATVIAAWAPAVVVAQRDRGVNQPGAAGNRGVGDPGLNQPGAVGNAGYGGSARQVRAVSDPGLNQPGPVGNAGRDPGFNQPGAAGNR